MKKLLLLACCLLAPASLWAQAPTQSQMVRATLVSEYAAITPGEPVHAGMLLEPTRGWHTYWENPGDAGLATALEWKLPAGFSAKDIDWPAPELLKEGALATFSYSKPVFLPVDIIPAANLDPSVSYPLHVKASWLVCKDICIPESAELEMTLPVSAAPPHPTASAALFAKHRLHRPAAVEPAGSYVAQPHQLTLAVPLAALKVTHPASAYFFPREQNLIRYDAEQTLAVHGDTLELTLERTDGPLPENISGILSVSETNGEAHYFDIAFHPASAPAAGKTGGLALALLFALLGGLVLNLMPCVLPVLSLKALAIAKKSGHERPIVIRMGVAYTLGILVSFALLAGILLGLRQGGEAVGWGYQMQSPAFVGFLVYLLFMVGLNLSGLFHLPVLLGGLGGDIANESSARGSFFTGILAAAVATPCTAPFMASAVGVALTLPPLEALLIFEMLGLGLALPFLLVSLCPPLLRFLPKPGRWMELFKQILAFPMYGSVIWLLWVLTLQTGPGGMVVALTSLLAIVMTMVMRPFFNSPRRYRVMALLFYGLILGISLPALTRMEIGALSPMESRPMDGVKMLDFSKEKLAELRAAGKPVFIDATAAWCITCQVNAHVAIHTERTMAAFKKAGITLMIANWTRRNDNITEFLSGFGYKGVPLYVFYPANHSKPVVLPQLLTQDIVINTITEGH